MEKQIKKYTNFYQKIETDFFKAFLFFIKVFYFITIILNIKTF